MSPEMRTALKNRGSTIPFFLVHAAALAALFFPLRWEMVALAVGSYYLRMFGVTAGYHRYFAHRSYKTSRPFQFVLAFLAQTSAQKGVLWWAGHHRAHHAYSDTEQDVHSPVRRGFWWAHVGWILSRDYDHTDFDRIKDFARYPELRFLNRFKLLPAVLYAGAILAIWGWEGLFWGFFVSTVALFHGTFFINSLAHVFGRRRFPTEDTSRNGLLLALIANGEGWHNNHHYFQTSARQGFYWWEIDTTYYVLRALAALRIVRDLREPPAKVLELGRHRVRRRATALAFAPAAGAGK
ncbi:MAG: acyl-CoA desaturase [Myxococcales bacterium]